MKVVLVVENREYTSNQTGFTFDVVDLEKGLSWILDNSARSASFGLAARTRSIRLWSYETVAPQHSDFFKHAINVQRNHLHILIQQSLESFFDMLYNS